MGLQNAALAVLRRSELIAAIRAEADVPCLAAAGEPGIGLVSGPARAGAELKGAAVRFIAATMPAIPQSVAIPAMAMAIGLVRGMAIGHATTQVIMWAARHMITHPITATAAAKLFRSSKLRPTAPPCIGSEQCSLGWFHPRPAGLRECRIILKPEESLAVLPAEIDELSRSMTAARSAALGYLTAHASRGQFHARGRV